MPESIAPINWLRALFASPNLERSLINIKL